MPYNIEEYKSKAPEMQVDSFWVAVGTGDIIYGCTRKLALHFFDPTNTILPHPPAEIWETTGRKGVSNFLCFALAGGLLLLHLLLSQGFRYQFLKLFVLELLLGLDELRLVP